MHKNPKASDEVFILLHLNIPSKDIISYRKPVGANMNTSWDSSASRWKHLLLGNISRGFYNHRVLPCIRSEHLVIISRLVMPVCGCDLFPLWQWNRWAWALKWRPDSADDTCTPQVCFMLSELCVCVHRYIHWTQIVNWDQLILKQIWHWGCHIWIFQDEVGNVHGNSLLYLVVS